MLRSLRAPRARLAWRLGGFVTNRHESCGLGLLGRFLEGRIREDSLLRGKIACVMGGNPLAKRRIGRQLGIHFFEGTVGLVFR